MTGALVLGMHRSGTSTVAGLAAAMGLDAGADPRTARAGPNNQRGFWEIRPLSEIDEELLRASGGSWSAPPPDGWHTGVRQGLERRAARTLARHLPGDPWVWKDPRLCLALPFWLGMGLRPGLVVIVHRHPVAVAQSLERRNGFPFALGLALWERYNLAALEHARALPTAVLGYEELIAGPAGGVSDLARWLTSAGLLAHPSDPTPFIDPLLNHAAPTSGSGPTSPAVDDLRALLGQLRGFHASGLASPTGLRLSPVATTAIEAHRSQGIRRYGRARRELLLRASRLRQRGRRRLD